jgi:hypothetical protein
MNWTTENTTRGSRQLTVGAIVAHVCYDTAAENTDQAWETYKRVNKNRSKLTKAQWLKRSPNAGRPWYPMVNGKCLFADDLRLQFPTEEQAAQAAEAEVVRQVREMAAMVGLSVE